MHFYIKFVYFRDKLNFEQARIDFLIKRIIVYKNIYTT